MSAAKKRRRRRHPEPLASSFIDAQTLAVSHGPVSLDVDLARRWGWTERAIKRAYDLLCGISWRRTRAAQRRYPGRWRWEHEQWTFVGPPPLGKPPRRRRGES